MHIEIPCKESVYRLACPKKTCRASGQAWDPKIQCSQAQRQDSFLLLMEGQLFCSIWAFN